MIIHIRDVQISGRIRGHVHWAVERSIGGGTSVPKKTAYSGKVGINEISIAGRGSDYSVVADFPHSKFAGINKMEAALQSATNAPEATVRTQIDIGRHQA